MIKANSPEMKRVFEIFEEISAIPRGSGNMGKIAAYCEDFAKKNSLRYIRDTADNIVIFKNGSKGYETAEPIILQGHLDMVCQRKADRNIDFLKDGLEIYTEGGFVKANGTTLGADNGIAVAFILSILESKDIPHPALEAVFTTDEEIGMIGAMQLDMSVLSAKKMINLDAEEDDTLTVSCAGGSDFTITVPISRNKKQGTEVEVKLKGLKGGHSGVEINSGRVNANILAGRFLNHIKNVADFEILSINGGDKSNAIPNNCSLRLCVENIEKFKTEAEAYLEVIKTEISAREPDFSSEITVGETKEYNSLDKKIKESLIYLLVCAPNGVMDMSAEIENLVETSLNLGILETKEEEIYIHFSLRSNKISALAFLEERLEAFSKCISGVTKTFGHYPPWEFKENSALQALYKECFKEQFHKEPKVEAIHAGLECGVFASGIHGLDCIAMGPALYDVHTVNEKMSISSAEEIYKLLLKILKKSK